ncbi:MAG TPA: ATPase, T2SS/T4P/T4SS family [Gemmatimonadaceae bacterium]|nr:ATPase, T2SS/T4P/T4SS family [Gemmatimonadaceae bacterium]
MHWLAAAAARAGIKGADSLVIPGDISLVDSWEIASRTLGSSAPELASSIAAAFGLAEADFEKAEPRALALLPERIARKYHVFPLREDDRHLVVATSDPTNIEVEHAIGFASGRRPIFELASPSAIDEALRQAYASTSSIDQLLSSVDEQVADAVRIVEDLQPEQVGAAEVDSAPVVKLTNLILRDAIQQGASDIHVEPGLKGGTVRFRVDGVMRQYMHLPMAALNRVVSRIKVLGKLDIADRLRPQDGRSKVAIDGRYVDLRISTVATRDAEKAVIRILRPENTRKLDEVGITPRELARLRQLLNCRDGIVIVTGPTGSGKTTTLYSAIREIATGELNISTVEDPVEYELPGITQIQVDPKRGVTFANSLRALLRQDPDVIFVGEIRDAETAQIAAQAAMTGHLVLATLHTNDAMSSITRLLDLGLDRQTIATTLRGTLAQRLIRRVCPDCAQPLIGSLTEEEESLGARFGVLPLSRAVGCKKCGNTGYRGRLPLIEVAVITPSIADMIAGGATAHALQRAAIAQGMAPMRDVAIARVRRGETTLQEIERVIGDNIDERAQHHSGPPSILVVNADPAWRRMARALLEGGGFRVSEAVDAAQAMQIMSAGEEFALMVTDLMMPSLAPVSAGYRAPSLRPTTAIPVINLPPEPAQPALPAPQVPALPDPQAQAVDWARFAATVQSSVRRTEH